MYYLTQFSTLKILKGTRGPPLVAPLRHRVRRYASTRKSRNNHEIITKSVVYDVYALAISRRNMFRVYDITQSRRTKVAAFYAFPFVRFNGFFVCFCFFGRLEPRRGDRAGYYFQSNKTERSWPP